MLSAKPRRPKRPKVGPPSSRRAAKTACLGDPADASASPRSGSPCLRLQAASIQTRTRFFLSCESSCSYLIGSVLVGFHQTRITVRDPLFKVGVDAAVAGERAASTNTVSLVLGVVVPVTGARFCRAKRSSTILGSIQRDSCRRSSKLAFAAGFSANRQSQMHTPGHRSGGFVRRKPHMSDLSAILWPYLHNLSTLQIQQSCPLCTLPENEDWWSIFSG